MPRLVDLATLQQFSAVNLSSDPGDLGGPKIIPSCAQIVINWSLTDGKAAHNVLVGRYSGAFHGSQTEANALTRGLLDATQWAPLAGFLAPGTLLGGVTIRDINTKDQPLISPATPGSPGTSAGTALPDEVAVVVTLRTAFAGRASRGRMFIPGWATNALGAGNVIAAGAVTALSNWAAIIAGVLSAQGYVWCVGNVARAQYTGSTGTIHPARPAGSIPITNVVVRDNHWDSQRRRGLR